MTDTQPDLPKAETASLEIPRFAALRTIVALVLREMSSTYGRSPGGYIWALLQPIASILFLSVGFSLMLRSPSLGSSFLLFYATGFLPYNMYGNISGRIQSALNYSRALLAYPRVTWIDAVLARFILNFITNMMVFGLLVAGILAVVDTHTVLDAPTIATALSLSGLLALGIGLTNCVVGGLFPVWLLFWSVLTRPLFLASGIFYIYEDLPRVVQSILWWNPLLHITGLARAGFYPTYQASFVSVPFVLGIALTLIALGLVLMRGHYKSVLQVS